MRFPHGVRAVSDVAHAHGLKLILWMEPERVHPGTDLYKNHPEWLLGKDGSDKLFNLGNPVAWAWMVDHVDHLINEQGIDLYRQDFNEERWDSGAATTHRTARESPRCGMLKDIFGSGMSYTRGIRIC